MKIAIALSSVEEKMINDLKEQFGYHAATEIFRDALRLLYQEKMPAAYIRKTAREVPKEAPKVLTAEEWAKGQGGELFIQEDGKKYARIMDGAVETLIPIPEQYA